MSLRTLTADLFTIDLETRMPFRYGMAEVTTMPHLLLRLRVQVDEQEVEGWAGENLPPKWFTKDPDTTFEDDLKEILEVIKKATELALAMDERATPFRLWQDLYAAQARWAEETHHPPLLYSFGVSLVERAVIDAFCRRWNVSFRNALLSGDLGLDLGEVHSELTGFQPADLLPTHPNGSIIVRHTVGMGDPLRDGEIGPAARLDDGLPQSLEASIATYGLTHFKIKIGGDPEEDVARLQAVCDLLSEREVRSFFTIDGNESYAQVSHFVEFWERLNALPIFDRLRENLLFVEQPLPRDIALSDQVASALAGWVGAPKIVIDESDDEPPALVRALEIGYAGCSHKNCKGVFKGIANACLIALRNQRTGAQKLILSGEDLSTIGPVALEQDLAVLATLGVEHAERNGYHYFAGLSALPPDLQQRTVDAHPDLYQTHSAPGHTFPALDIDQGRISLNGVIDAPFGYRVALRAEEFDD